MFDLFLELKQLKAVNQSMENSLQFISYPFRPTILHRVHSIIHHCALHDKLSYFVSNKFSYIASRIAVLDNGSGEKERKKNKRFDKSKSLQVCCCWKVFFAIH